MKILCQSYNNDLVNRYVFNIYPKSFKVYNLNLKNLILYGQNIAHLHWPESLLNEKKYFLFFLKLINFSLIIFLIKIKRIKCVWTVHNLKPHDLTANTKFIDFYYNFLIKITDGFIFLSKSSEKSFRDSHNIPKSKEAIIIPHPLYEKEYNLEKGIINPFKSESYFLMFGNFRSYKNTKRFLTFIAETNVNVLFAGKFFEKGDLDFIKNLSKKNKHIKYVNKFLTQNELNSLIYNSKGILIPYKIPLNSGVVFHSISFQKRVFLNNNNDISDIEENFKKFILKMDLKDFQNNMKNLKEDYYDSFLDEKLFKKYNDDVKIYHDLFFKKIL